MPPRFHSPTGAHLRAAGLFFATPRTDALQGQQYRHLHTAGMGRVVRGAGAAARLPGAAMNDADREEAFWEATVRALLAFEVPEESA